MTIDDIARDCASRFLTCERELLEALAVVDAHREFEKFGFTSLFRYCVERLKLSESNSYALIAVLRKSRKVPELGEAVADGLLSVSQAKRIVAVIEPANASTWIEKAATLKQRDLEREVAKSQPAPPPTSRIRHVGGEMSELKLVVPARLRAKLERLMEVRGASSLDAIEFALDEALKRHDPEAKAQRNAAKPAIPQPSSRKARTAIPAAIKHAVMLRDRATARPAPCPAAARGAGCTSTTASPSPPAVNTRSGTSLCFAPPTIACCTRVRQPSARGQACGVGGGFAPHPAWFPSQSSSLRAGAAAPR